MDSVAASVNDGLEQLRQSRIALERALERVPAERRSEKPGPDRWSAAEVLEHLVLVEGGIARMLEKAAAELPDEVTAEAATPIEIERIANRARRIETTERATPSLGLDWRQGWEALDVTRRSLLGVVESLSPETLARIRAPHRLFGLLDGIGWMHFVAGHELRHADQIEEIAHELDG